MIKRLRSMHKLLLKIVSSDFMIAREKVRKDERTCAHFSNDEIFKLKELLAALVSYHLGVAQRLLHRIMGKRVVSLVERARILLHWHVVGERELGVVLMSLGGWIEHTRVGILLCELTLGLVAYWREGGEQARIVVSRREEGLLDVIEAILAKSQQMVIHVVELMLVLVYEFVSELRSLELRLRLHFLR